MSTKAIIFDANGVLTGKDNLLANEKVIQELTKLHDTGVKFFILSNGSGRLVHSDRQVSSFVRKYFSAEYYSYVTGNIKPDKDAFMQVCFDWDLKPNECLLVDDGVDNIMVAKNLGFNVFNFTGVEDFLKVFD